MYVKAPGDCQTDIHYLNILCAAMGIADKTFYSVNRPLCCTNMSVVERQGEQGAYIVAEIWVLAEDA